MMRNRAKREAMISSTKPNFGNTITKLVNYDQEAVEELQNWQHKNLKGINHVILFHNNPFQPEIDQEFKKKYLDPIEDQSNKGFEILLKDPIFKNSNIITDPRKLSERFNRSHNEEEKEAGRSQTNFSPESSEVKLRSIK